MSIMTSTHLDFRMLALSFLVPWTFSVAIDPLFQRTIQYGLLNAPCFLAANFIASLLLVAIPWYKPQPDLTTSFLRRLSENVRFG